MILINFNEGVVAMFRDTQGNVEQFICLAVSRKEHAYCIGGKRLDNQTWCRIVNDISGGAIIEQNCKYQDGNRVSVCDIVSVKCLQQSPCGHHLENVCIDLQQRYWTKIGSVSWSYLQQLVDKDNGLWENGHHSSNGFNNRVQEQFVDNQLGSLRFIKINDLTLRVFDNGYGLKKYGLFTYESIQYQLNLTDPYWEEMIYKGDIVDGHHFNDEVLCCISLASAFSDKYCYKLLASIITKEMVEK